MTVDEIKQAVERQLVRDSKLKDDLVHKVRSLIPVLKDHNLEQTAQALEEILFQIDANKEERDRVFAEDPESTLQYMFQLVARMRE